MPRTIDNPDEAAEIAGLYVERAQGRRLKPARRADLLAKAARWYVTAAAHAIGTERADYAEKADAVRHEADHELTLIGTVERLP